MQEMQVESLSREDPVEKEMATHSSILAWRIPWMEELGWQAGIASLQRRLAGYSPWGHKELDMTERAQLIIFYNFRKKSCPRLMGNFA